MRWKIQFNNRRDRKTLSNERITNIWEFQGKQHYVYNFQPPHHLREPWHGMARLYRTMQHKVGHVRKWAHVDQSQHATWMSLRFVYCHCKSQLNGKLPLLEVNGKVETLNRWWKCNLRNKGKFSVVIPLNEMNLKHTGRYMQYCCIGPITEALFWIQVSEKNDWASFLKLWVSERKARSIWGNAKIQQVCLTHVVQHLAQKNGH
jgi:hypothetical protein